ncbi:transmembrane protein [Caldimonas brevitalea]|uniref:Transmembrane protein n=1 Tax=Caldimonas brevitalea TaxID=413882 RepID=A0A0G3BMR0_9BURK|nr:transmembrane protein [Caldimonas brevitalea]
MSFTVHSVPTPRLDDDARRTRTGRIKMLLVLLVCAAPVIASYFTYYVIRPQGRINYGELIEPQRTLPALALRTLDGAPVDAQTLKHQWLLVVVAPAGCDAGCERRLYLQRQLRETLGRDRDRLDKLWFVTDQAAVRPELLRGIEGAQVLRVGRDALTGWLAPAPGHALEDHLYLVDPMGNWMMRFPAEADPAKIKRDLTKLLRASQSWDQAGR